MYGINDYMSSSEQLVAFLDGELSQEDTSQLFYELAHNPDLQEEMKQYMQMRNTLKNSLLEPPAHLKNNILINTGLKEGPVSTFMDASSKVAAMLIGMFYNRTSLSVLVLALLSLGTVFLLNNNINDLTADNSAVKNSKSVSGQSAKIPVTESYSDNTGNDSHDAKRYFSDKPEDSRIAANSGKSSQMSENSLKHVKNLISANNEVPVDKNIYGQNMVPEEMNNNINNISRSSFQNDLPSFVNVRKKSGKRIYNSEQGILANIMQNSTIFIKQFGTVSSFPDFGFDKNINPLINNMSIEFRYNLSPEHSLGITGGYENFLMTFEKEKDGIIYQYNQSWNGYWFGLAYHYNIGEIAESGFTPDFNLLAGSTVVGPVFKAGAGLNYNVTENIYFNGGIEYGILVYSENQPSSTAKWFSTNKIIWTFGIGIGL